MAQPVVRVRLVGIEPEDLTAEDLSRLQGLIQKQLGATDGALRQSLVNVAALRGSVIITATVYRVVDGQHDGPSEMESSTLVITAEEIRGALRPDLQDKITGVVDLLEGSKDEALPLLAPHWEAPVLPGGLEGTELEIALELRTGGESGVGLLGHLAALCPVPCPVLSCPCCL